MLEQNFSDAYVRLLLPGPFPAMMDPWAEDDHYFHQIHGGIIDHLLVQMKEPLAKAGYYAAKEISLQITAGREPDISVQRVAGVQPSVPVWDYELAAIEMLAEPGEVLYADVPMEALHIRRDGSLVTVVEIISFGNKDRTAGIMDYQTRRERLVVEHGVNVVEIDLTRSTKRMISHPAVNETPYHVAIFLPGAGPRFIGMKYSEKLKRIALPLRGSGIPVELQDAYAYAYQMAMIASQINNEVLYSEASLHMPSLLTDAQKRTALNSVARWREQLEILANEGA